MVLNGIGGCILILSWLACAVFTYTPLHDVLEVNQLEYATCQTVNPISAHNSGDTVVPLIEPGTRYFICGRNGHCASGLKFRVDVLPQLDANITRRTPRSPHRSPPSPPLRHPTPPPPPMNSSSDGKEPDIPSDPGFDSPGPCGNSAVGDMITDWFSYSWWVPLATTLLVSLDFPGFSFA